MERGRGDARAPHASARSPRWPSSPGSRIVSVDAAPAPRAATVHATPGRLGRSRRSLALGAPVVGLAATPTGKGYWRVGADGGVLTAGDAHFYGSATGRARTTRSSRSPRRAPVTATGSPTAAARCSPSATPRSTARWPATAEPPDRRHGRDARRQRLLARRQRRRHLLVQRDRSTARPAACASTSRSSAWPRHRPATATGSSRATAASSRSTHRSTARPARSTSTSRSSAWPPRPSGGGYTMVAADGGLFRFGAASPFYGSAVNACPGAPAVAVAMSPGADGYWITFADARTYAFSPSSSAPKCKPADRVQDRRRWRPTCSPA